MNTYCFDYLTKHGFTGKAVVSAATRFVAEDMFLKLYSEFEIVSYSVELMYEAEENEEE